MFSKKQKQQESKRQTKGNKATTPNGVSNNIVVGTAITGTIVSQSDIRIDGELEGDLECTGRVIIGATGNIKGEINCENAIIEGVFEGVLKVSESLTAKETAHISGEVITGKLHIQQGAIFNATCTMGGQKISSFDKEQIAKNK